MSAICPGPGGLFRPMNPAPPPPHPPPPMSTAPELLSADGVAEACAVD